MITCSNYKCEDLKEHLLQQERIEKGLQLLEEKEKINMTQCFSGLEQLPSKQSVVGSSPT